MSHTKSSDRRTFLKTTGAVGAASVLPHGGTAAADSTKIDDSFDLSADGLEEALVVFDANDDVDRLATLDLANGYHRFEVLPIGYTELTSDQIRTVADWPEVRYVQANEELVFHNDDARSTTRANAVHSDLGYTGGDTHAVVIDTGVDGDHPDLTSSLEHNYRFVNPLDRETMWVDAGIADTDDNGHGTHTSGSVAGDGTKSGGTYQGMARDATLTVYSTGVTLLVVNAVGAYDHLLERQQAGETNVQVVSNSWGATGGANFDPDDAINVATWNAFQEGILPVFSAGNSGPDSNTLNPYATGPHVLGVAATFDDKTVTDFSSRGRTPSFNGNGSTNYDRKTALDNLRTYYETGAENRPLGIYRNGVGAPGNYVMSTLAPEDPLQGYAAGTGHEDTLLWYGRISGTSMSCPVTAGAAALVIDAYYQNHSSYPDPIDVLNTLEAEAEDVHDSYNPWNIGAGYVDAYDAAVRAENGNLATFGDVTLTSY
jgi:serine protease AprX